MIRALIMLCAASTLSLASCRDAERDGFVQAACSDAGECFDARVASDGTFVMPDATDRADAIDAMPDAIDAMPDAVDAMPDAIDAMPDAIDAMPDAIDAMPGAIDAMPDAMPDAEFEPPDSEPRDMVPAADMSPAVDMAPPVPDSGLPPEPVSSCAEINSVECFGHPDCPDEERCLNVGTDALVVPCCVPGRRGAIEPGGSCADVDGQVECQSGVCIEDVGGDDLCSGPCEGPDDCPDAMPRCVAFPFGGTDFMWCFPE